MNQVKKSFFVIGLLAFVFGLNIPMASASLHSLGTNVSGPDGTVYTISGNIGNTQTTRRPYTSAGAFLSYGFNSWGSVVPASAEDMALPVGSFVPPQSGKIICSNKGTDKGTCYVISQGKKLGFPSAAIFTQQGFSFSHAVFADISFLPSGEIIQDGNQAHKRGTIINIGGFFYFVGGDTRLVAFPDDNSFKGWGYSFADVVPGNAADRAAHDIAVLPPKILGMIGLDDSSYQTAVIINTFSSSSGSVGTQVTITGSGFTTTGNDLHFGDGGIRNVSSSNNGTTLTFSVPKFLGGAACDFYVNISCGDNLVGVKPGNYSVYVVNANGSSNTQTFTVTSSNEPVISWLNPSSGPAGTHVAIMGSGFATTGNVVNVGGGIVSDVLFSSNGTSLTFTLEACPYNNPQCPGHLLNGPVHISVTNANGTSNALTFTITGEISAPPKITSLSQTSGKVGTVVTITGSNFATTNTVNFGSAGAYPNIVSNDGSTITFTVPTQDNPTCAASNPMCPLRLPVQIQPGTYDISISNAYGNSNAQTFTVTQ